MTKFLMHKSEIDLVNTTFWEKVIQLSGCVTENTFENSIYELLSEIADIDHFAVVIIDPARATDQRLFLVGGNISDHWAQYSAKHAAEYSKKSNRPFDYNIELIAKNIIDPVGIFQFKPDPATQPELASLYEKSKLLEKIYGLRVIDGRIYQLNLFRSISHSSFTERDVHQFEKLLPLIMNHVLLHAQFYFSDESDKRSEKHVVSFFKEKGVEYFKPLTGKETEVCDLIIFGQTTRGIAAEMGLAESTVKTYRERAYKKLGINSKSELFAMIINSQIHSS